MTGIRSLNIDLFFVGHQDATVGGLLVPCLLGTPICHGNATKNAIRLDISALRLLVCASCEIFIEKLVDDHHQQKSYFSNRPFTQCYF